jgi:hypothetical protein
MTRGGYRGRGKATDRGRRRARGGATGIEREMENERWRTRERERETYKQSESSISVSHHIDASHLLKRTESSVIQREYSIVLQFHLSSKRVEERKKERERVR